ncbi:cyanophycin synthetase, partial [Clostridioides difficile]|uniref:Mur ligase family protein n=1 Tax=Clostridioides difficile TaxID=1496 RepID=UPI0017D1FC37
TGYNSTKTILQNKDVEVAVLEVARGGLIRKGLAYDVADVAVITNITEDHLGIDDVNDIEQLAFVKALVGEAVKEDGYVVVNADENWIKNIVSRIKAKKNIIDKDRDNPLIEENIKSGGITINVKDDILTVMNNKREEK